MNYLFQLDAKNVARIYMEEGEAGVYVMQLLVYNEESMAGQESNSLVTEPHRCASAPQKEYRHCPPQSTKEPDMQPQQKSNNHNILLESLCSLRTLLYYNA
ncbi:hypothetical protein XENOCAPTIV_017668 [Xenoophorus captivus]|uniref:Uncharacterized protein n=1 Tax=Xenoophorus captivus TaxID=1517983 RepID=A0ABV0QM44_9TELE